MISRSAAPVTTTHERDGQFLCFELPGLLTAGSSQHREKRSKRDALWLSLDVLAYPSFPQNPCKVLKTCGTICSAMIMNTVSRRAQVKSIQPSCTCFMRGGSFPSVFVYGSHRYLSSSCASERGPVTCSLPCCVHCCCLCCLAVLYSLSTCWWRARRRS